MINFPGGFVGNIVISPNSAIYSNPLVSTVAHSPSPSEKPKKKNYAPITQSYHSLSAP